MADVAVETIPALITAADTTDNVLIFDEVLEPLLTNPQRIAFIEIVTGTFRFSVGAAITGDEPQYTEGEKLPVTFTDELDLHFKATTNGDQFKLTV